MSKIIPKESLSAYQRWELNALDGDQPFTQAPPQVPAETPASPPEPAVVLPTAEDVERIHQQAFQEGYNAGYLEGRATAQREAQQLHALTMSLGESLQEFDKSVSHELMGLALEIAKQFLRESLRVRPDLILAVVREAINSLPQAHQHPVLVLHPEDAALVRTHLASELAHGAWRILEDGRLRRGGCRIETSASDLDATVEQRWKRLTAALGKDDSWLD